MRFNYPHHLILDVAKSNLTYSNDYWVLHYSKSFTKDQYFNTTLNFINKPSLLKIRGFKTEKESTTVFKNQPNFFQNTNTGNKAISERVQNLETAKKNFLANTPKLAKNQHNLGVVNSSGKFTPNNLHGDMFNEDKKFKINHLMSRSLTHLLFDINFIKKERLYTKLKYSRSPAYDIVSGGAAALLSGFIGFLISEKFGIELVDSGDFYIVFMYAVFISLSCRPLLRIIDVHKKGWSIFSLNHAFDYFQTLFYFLISWVKPFLSKIYLQISYLFGTPSFLNILLIILFFLIW